MPSATYEFKVDTLRDGSYSASIDDLTSRLIGNVDFNVGMNAADQDFAVPSRLNLVLDNIDGAFNPDTLGADVITNGTFTAWTGSVPTEVPTGWTVAGVSGFSPYITQTAADHQAGTGACSFASSTSSTDFSISQIVLTVGTTYRVDIDISFAFPPKDYSNVTGALAIYCGSTRVSPYYRVAGKYTCYFNATSTTFKITAVNTVSGYTMYTTVDSVSVKPVSLYGMLLTEGTLGRLKATFNAVTYTLFIGRLASFLETPSTISKRVVSLQFTDITGDLLDVEYLPILDTNVTADTAILRVLAEAVVPFPYAHTYWMLETQGASELDLTTAIYQAPSYAIDTGKTTYAWVGDNQIDTNKGVSAQTYLRDVVKGEVNGRFFYDPSLPGYTFHNRHRDPLNQTVALTITESDYEPDNSIFERLPVINKTAVTYSPRKTGTPATVIWSADDLPQTISPGITTKSARYRDLSNPSARVGATDVIPLLAGTDYIVTDENGVDLTDHVSMSMTAGANSADIKINNFDNKDLTITTLQVRGTPITTFDPQTIESVSVDSEYKYRVAPERISYNLISAENDARAIADYRVYKNSDAVPAFRAISFIANKSSARMVNAFTVDVGSRITVSDTWMAHSSDYFVVGIRHAITWGGEHTHVTTLTLKPAVRESFWILDTSLLGNGTRLSL